MFTRPVLAFAALLLVSPGCGPEDEALPPSGIYRMTAVTLENDCHPKLDDDHTGEEVVHVTPEWIKVPLVQSSASPRPVRRAWPSPATSSCR
ncbi:hypothetical protein OV079_08725 [Nannocystis pusilla]|uniref:Uncharacterized protein n=1 Tax=Nannocystis pusilla TaxID=889268 RepID=A0A9X3EM23_9BACT|nr:hypothetical protein [Nannocystis pusilla]MCY1005649.1 hypothetical protein [Nannocystis pusilla]